MMLEEREMTAVAVAAAAEKCSNSHRTNGTRDKPTKF